MTSPEAPELRRIGGADGAILQYETLGVGRPVVFLHGRFTTRFAWNRQKPLAERFRLILRDLRGHDGALAVVPDGYGFDTTEVEDMESVLDAEDVAEADIVAHSTGATIAVHFAGLRPERVGRLVLIEPTMVSLYSEGVFNGLMGEGIEDKDGETLLDDAMRAMVGASWRESISEKALARLLAQAPIIRAYGLAHTRDHFRDEGLANVVAPTLCLYGSYDDPAQQEVFDAIGRMRPDMERRRIAGAGHNVHSDQPDEVNAAILAFLAS